MKQKKCKVCGDLFTPRNSLQNCCSPVCYYKYIKVKTKMKPPKVVKKTRKKKTSNKRWKDKAWKIFSAYIRTRDCLKTTGTTDEGICYTCGKKLPFKQLQCGHCISGRGNYILLNEDCVKAQCMGCNVFNKGNYDIFIPKIIREHSLAWFEKHKRLSKIPFKRNWEEEYIKYRDKYEKLVSSKNLPF